MIKLLFTISLILCFSLNAKTIRVATSPDYKPFEFIEGEKIVGMEIDLIEEIARRENWTIEYVQMGFSSIIQAVASKKVDMGVAGFSKGEGRNIVEFSDTYFKSDKPVAIVHYNKLKTGSKVAGQTGTESANFIKSEHPYLELVEIEDYNVIVEMLKTKRIQGAVINSEFVKEVMKKVPKTKVSYFKKKSEGMGMIFPKKSPLKDTINKHLKDFEEEGYFKSLQKKWEERDSGDDVIKFKKALWILAGIFETLKYTIVSLCFGLFLGIFIAIARMSSVSFVKYFAWLYVNIIRGSPLLLQVFLIYFCLPMLIKKEISVFISGVAALSMNSGAYISEIIRSGVNAISSGQFEAAKVLKIPKFNMYKDIILPQTFKNILPALINEAISITKESAVLSVIGAVELTKRANIIAAQTYEYLMPLLISAIGYLILTSFFEAISHFINKKYFYVETK